MKYFPYPWIKCKHPKVRKVILLQCGDLRHFSGIQFKTGHFIAEPMTLRCDIFGILYRRPSRFEHLLESFSFLSTWYTSKMCIYPKQYYTTAVLFPFHHFNDRPPQYTKTPFTVNFILFMNLKSFYSINNYECNREESLLIFYQIKFSFAEFVG